jgi:hypothetical protein
MVKKINTWIITAWRRGRMKESAIISWVLPLRQFVIGLEMQNYFEARHCTKSWSSSTLYTPINNTYIYKDQI